MIFQILVGKLVLKILQLLSRSGSTWPGHIVLKLNNKFVAQTISKNPQLKIIIIAGTNGKTTTTSLIRHALKENNITSFQNTSGANLRNGIASSIIANLNIFGEIKSENAIFEVDENALPQILNEINPDALVLLNLFRDQLDRYGEVNLITKKWQYAISKLPKKTIIFANGDDPALTYIVKKSEKKSQFFSANTKSENKELDNDADFLYCPNCKNKLTFAFVSFSHLGDFKCSKCGFENEKLFIFDKSSSLFGSYNKYNVSATALVLETVFELDEKKIENSIKSFKPAFGRQEELTFKNRRVSVILSKNPASFNRSIEAINQKSKAGDTLLIILNDRVPDGRDVSWIWDVDFENLNNNFKKIFLSGDRIWDLAIKFKYDGFKNTQNFEDLKKGIIDAVSKTPSENSLFILPTYSAMLDVRKIITGRKIL